MHQTFSANLGFLWSDFSLPDAIRAAANAGFDAVECHWPYDEPVDVVSEALGQTGLKMLGLNTSKGGAEEFGLSALTGREAEARAAIDQAIAYAVSVNAQSIHVMAGIANGPEAHRVFSENILYSCQKAAKHELTILVEPINTKDVPGYFLTTTEQAKEIIDTLNQPNLKLMFDCYHVAITEGDPIPRIKALLPYIGHIQFASVPDRGPPEEGVVSYDSIFNCLSEAGWTKPLGAEYKPMGQTEASLGWLQSYRETGRLTPKG